MSAEPRPLQACAHRPRPRSFSGNLPAVRPVRNGVHPFLPAVKIRLVLILLTLVLAANAVRLAFQPDTPADAAIPLAGKRLPVTNVPDAAGKNGILPAAWSALHSDDPAIFTANLRAAGFPDHVVRALIIATIEDRFRAREAALPLPAKVPYWQMSFTNEPLETSLARLDLKREKTRLREQLLGPDPMSAEEESFPIAPEKRAQFRMLVEDYGTLIAEARSRAGAGAVATEKKELEFLESEQKRELAELLTPQELADFAVARSGAVLDLRSQLRYFEPTDAEFQVIAAVAKERRDQMQSTEPRATSAAAQQAREETRDRQEADLKAVLGEQRYAEYQRASDADYRLLRDVAGRAQLPAETAAQAFDLRAATLASATALMENQSMAAEAKKAAVAQLVEDARAKLRAVLGAEAGDAYLRGAETANSWLGYLSRGIVQVPMSGGRISIRPIYSGATPFRP